jgi:thiol-disulfide isomerase/thioredoxin
MQRLLLVVTIVSLPANYVCAQDIAKAPRVATETVESVQKAYREAMMAYGRARRAEREKAAKEGLKLDLASPRATPNLEFSQRFLTIAENDPEGPEAIDALKAAIESSYVVKEVAPNTFSMRDSKLETYHRAIKLLRDHYVTKPAIKGVLKGLAMDDDEDAKALVEDVISRNPDRSLRGFALRAKRSRLATAAGFDAEMADPKYREHIEKTRTPAWIADKYAKATTAKGELAAVNKVLQESYADLTADLTIGSPAPELELPALSGELMRLSAFKGKVVVLDIWATWCGPCREMIPHERLMVERLKDRPFALVSISVDEKKETLTNFLDKEKMPWTHLWNGSEGGIINRWDVTYYPTIYVIDAQGVIRFKDLRDAELEKAVNSLLDEATKTSARAAATSAQ